MQIAVAATPAIAIPALRSLKERHQIAFLITQNDKPFGRGRELRESEVAMWGRENGIEVLKPGKFAEIAPRLSEVELVITIAYGQLIRESELWLPKHGFINLHYSLLPRWRGAAPVQRALLAGDSTSGVTVFQLDRGMDTGPIYTQRKLEIAAQWRAKELFEKLNEVGSAALTDAIAMIEAGVPPQPQVGEASYAAKIEKAEYAITFTESASAVVNKVRGLYPNAYCTLRGTRIKITAAAVGAPCSVGAGEVISLDPFTIATGSGTSIVIESVVPEGRREMSAQEWQRGARIEVGTRLG